VLLSLSLLAAASPAAAWTDARPAGLVTEVVVDRDGGATVTMRVRWRVVAGRFRMFELSELPADAMLVEATATDGQGAPVSIATRAPQPGRLEVSLGEAQGLRRGSVDVAVRFTTSLRAQGAIRRSGDDAIIELATVPWERGLEAAELRVATPSSIQRARWLSDETPGIESSVSSEVGRDVVRAVRRHLPAGTRWVGRIACDRALFPWLEAPAPPRAELQAAQRDRWLRPAIAALLATLFAGLALRILRTAPDRPRLLVLPARLRGAPLALAAIGGASMASTLDAAQGALSWGALATLLALMSVAPALEPLPRPSATRAARWERARVETFVRGLRRAPIRLGLWLATLSGLVAAGVGYATRSAALSLVGVSITVAMLGWITASRPRKACGEVLELLDVERSLALGKQRSVRTTWRVRSDGLGVGVAKLKLAPRPGHRARRGLEAIEWVVQWTPSILRWRALPMLCVRARRGSAIEKTLRIAGARAGRTVLSADGERIAWVVPWVGAERAVARRMLTVIVDEGFASIEEARASEAHQHRDDPRVGTLTDPSSASAVATAS
jgi:hypothetical protein